MMHATLRTVVAYCASFPSATAYHNFRTTLAMANDGSTSPIPYDISHGVLMSVAVILVLPLGSVHMRLGGSSWIHGVIQLFGLVLLLAGLGVGVKLAHITDQLYTGGSQAYNHTVLGTTIVALFLIQPFIGLWHHLQFRKMGSRGKISWMHIWYGRALMVLAVVNGGLGLQLAANTTKGEIIYGVLAGVVGVAYVLLVVVKRKGHGNEISKSG